MSAKPVYVINNPESVVEVFLNTQEETVIERKRLNGNRYKTYTYNMNDYMERNRHRAVYAYLQGALN